jgi:hypothetical protein
MVPIHGTHPCLCAYSASTEPQKSSNDVTFADMNTVVGTKKGRANPPKERQFTPTLFCHRNSELDPCVCTYIWKIWEKNSRFPVRKTLLDSQQGVGICGARKGKWETREPFKFWHVARPVLVAALRTVRRNRCQSQRPSYTVE